jgi:adenylate kinase
MSARIILLGAPNSGKGTQAAFLAGKLGVPAIATGDILRAARDAGSELGQRVKGVMAAGGLVDDVLMAEIIEDRLARADAGFGFVLDGYPRTPSQAETLATILRRQGVELDAVIALAVPEPTLISRGLARGRDDDREDVIRERLRVYHEKTEPLVEHYRSLGLLRDVDGSRPIELVTLQIMESISQGRTA